MGRRSVDQYQQMVTIADLDEKGCGCIDRNDISQDASVAVVAGHDALKFKRGIVRQSLMTTNASVLGGSSQNLFPVTGREFEDAHERLDTLYYVASAS